MKKQIFLLLLCTALFNGTVLSNEYDYDDYGYDNYCYDDIYNDMSAYNEMPCDEEPKPGTWTRLKNFCKRKWRWFWNNKKISLPLTAAVGAIGWDAVRLAQGKHTDKTWKETTKDSYVGIAGLSALPVLWGINRLCGHTVRGHTECNQTECDLSNMGDFLIKHHKSLSQGYTADCGYYAIYNACCLMKNTLDNLANRKKFERECAVWKQAVKKDRNQKRKNRYGTSDIDSGEIEEVIIKDHVPTLQGHHSEGGMKSVFLKENVSIIDNLDCMQAMIEQGAIGGIDRHNVRNINRFQKEKTPQVVIVNTSSGNVYASHNASWHWFAVKLSYKGDQIEITVVDSLSTSINQPIVEKIYQLFAHTNIPQEYM